MKYVSDNWEEQGCSHCCGEIHPRLSPADSDSRRLQKVIREKANFPKYIKLPESTFGRHLCNNVIKRFLHKSLYPSSYILCEIASHFLCVCVCVVENY